LEWSVPLLPLYEYQCTKCKHTFEKIQKFSDRPEKKCPKCGAKVEQLLSAPAIQFKGSGWYVNDYAKKSGGGKNAEGSAASSESKSESNSESKSESKAESKSESKSESKAEKKSPAAEKK
jgi:putative FmdB family regulatory protein